jgi:hypothetical protein
MLLNKQVLELEFRQSGEVYQYFDVPAQEHTAFLVADSKGTYLNVTSSAQTVPSSSSPIPAGIAQQYPCN